MTTDPLRFYHPDQGDLYAQAAAAGLYRRHEVKEDAHRLLDALRAIVEAYDGPTTPVATMQAIAEAIGRTDARAMLAALSYPDIPTE